MENKKITKIKNWFRDQVENKDTFYDRIPYSVTTTRFQWEMPSEKQISMYRDFALSIGDFISSLQSTEEREVVLATILLYGIEAGDRPFVYSLPSNDEIREMISKLGDHITITEEVLVPHNGYKREIGKEEIFKNDFIRVTNVYDAYVEKSPFYMRKVEWTLPIFRK